MRSTTSLLALACLLPTALPSQAARRVPVWTLKEEIRIGGAADGPENFVDIRGIGIARGGNIFVLAYDAQELRVFDPQGHFLKRAARRGQGPGELGNANGLAVGSDGTVWVNDPGNDRFSLYRDDGTFLKQVVVQINAYGYIWHGAVIKPGEVVDDMPIRVPDPGARAQDGRPAVAERQRIIAATGPIDTIPVVTCPGKPPTFQPYVSFRSSQGGATVGIPFVPGMLRVFTDRGTEWCTPGDSYRLLVGPIGGTLQQVVERHDPPVPVSDSERSAAIRRIDSLRLKYGPPQSGDPNNVPHVKPPIADLYADQAGNAWVRRTGVSASTPVFEVYDPSGRQLATVNSTGPVGDQTWIDGDTLLTVVLDADDIPYVVRYRIVR